MTNIQRERALTIITTSNNYTRKGSVKNGVSINRKSGIGFMLNHNSI